MNCYTQLAEKGLLNPPVLQDLFGVIDTFTIIDFPNNVTHLGFVKSSYLDSNAYKYTKDIIEIR